MQWQPSEVTRTRIRVIGVHLPPFLTFNYVKKSLGNLKKAQ